METYSEATTVRSTTADLFRDEIERLKEVMVEMPWRNRHFYGSFLSQTYYFVRHSTRLLATASGRADWDEDGLHRRSVKHIAEERGHDLLAMSDLRSLTDAPLEVELPETRNLYEPQYFKIERYGASALLGYILALEGVASLVVPSIMKDLYDTYGEKACRFLKLHAEEDPDHVEKALIEIESLPQEKIEVILANLRQSCINYEYFLRAIDGQVKSHALSRPASNAGHSNIRSTVNADTNATLS